MLLSELQPRSDNCTSGSDDKKMLSGSFVRELHPVRSSTFSFGTAMLLAAELLLV